MSSSPAIPPLVEPGPPLTRAQRQRYARHLLLPSVGEVGQRRLLAARVAVVGAGGLGSPALLYLAGAGVGHLTVIDDDDVDLTNLHRQVLHDADAVGSAKVDSAASRVRSLNPDVAVTPIRARLTDVSANELLAHHDVVIDGADNFDTRYIISDACAKLSVPHLWASVYRSQAQISGFWTGAPTPITLRDLFPSPQAHVHSCSDAAMLGPICGQVGSMLAGEAIKLICGIGRPVIGRLLLLDLLDSSQREIELRPSLQRTVTPGDAAPDLPGVATVSPAELVTELSSTNSPLVIDVREPAEWEMGMIDAALLLSLGDLEDGAAVPLDRPIVVTCKTGPRAERAAHLLAERGASVRVLAGGMLAWTREVDPSCISY